MSEVATIHPASVAFTLLMSLIVLAAPRRYILLPFLLVGIFITVGQNVIILGFNFMMLRMLIVVALVRVTLKGEYHSLRLNEIDKCFIVYIVFDVLTYSLLRMNYPGLVNRLGFALDNCGIYFFIRFNVRDKDDIFRAISFFGCICILLACAMTIEKVSGRNIFYFFGGVPQYTEIRQGTLRSQGPFGHPLLAGAFGGTFFAVFFGQWRLTGSPLMLLSTVAAITIAVTSASSGPIVAVLCSVIGLLAWILREHMRQVRWLIVAALVGLSLTMKAPVWALVARIKIFGASTGWYRYNIIDQAIKRFNEWWLLGTESTGHWGYMLWDVTNRYVQVAVEGGLLTLIAFITLVALPFRVVGRNIKAEDSPRFRYFYWILGVAWFAHSITLVGMTYFQSQILLNWLFILASISAMKIREERQELLKMQVGV